MERVCYVCGKVIDRKLLGIGQGLYRHDNPDCEPGGANYLANSALRPGWLALMGSPKPSEQHCKMPVFTCKIDQVSGIITHVRAAGSSQGEANE